jgi:hypothetical protein
MNCDVCNEEFANSEEVTRHKEQMHPMGDGKGPDIIEKPTTTEGIEPNDAEVPEPAERYAR